MPDLRFKLSARGGRLIGNGSALIAAAAGRSLSAIRWAAASHHRHPMAITLSAETTKQLHASIKRYFAENLDLEIGDLKAQMILEYCLKEIGPSIYNHAITDARAYFQDRVADLEGVCYEKELTYWAVADAERRGKH
jgi:uncharacterized protein (DUF2164 family)